MAKTNSRMLAVAFTLAACGEKAATSQPAPRPAPTGMAAVVPPSAAPQDEDAVGPSATLPPAAFKDHPAQVYTGPLAKPDINRGDAQVKMYRTRILKAAAGGVKFGGKYGVMISGCGTECIFGFVIDETNGHVIPLPVGGEEQRLLQLAFRPDSQWMRALWRASAWGEPKTCALQDFVIEAGGFRSLKKEVLPGACPEMGPKTGEASGGPLY